MLGSRIEEMLVSEDQQIQGQNAGNVASANTSIPLVTANIAIINDESKQKQLLQEDEEEDFLDEGKTFSLLTPMHTVIIAVYC